MDFKENEGILNSKKKVTFDETQNITVIIPNPGKQKTTKVSNGRVVSEPQRDSHIT